MASVVALHGFTGEPASWDPVAALLPAAIGLVRPTLLGHGAAAVESREVASFDDEVDRLAREIRATAPAPRLALGYSLGARVALGLLARHRDLFAGAVLIGVQPGLIDPAERERRRADDEAWARLLEEDGLEAFVDRWQALPLFASQERLEPELRRHHRRRRLAHDPTGLARSLRVLGLGAMPPRWDDLPRLALPVVLMAGELDGKFRRIAGRAAALLPRVAVETVAGAGHDLVLEAPAAVAAATVRVLDALR